MLTANKVQTIRLRHSRALCVAIVALYGSTALAEAPPSIVRVDNPAPLADAAFGAAVDGISDLDGDGAGDYIVGERGADKVHVISGADNAIIHTIRDLDGFSGYWFGYEVRNFGDLDGDGTEDIAVGAPGNLSGWYMPVPCAGDPLSWIIDDDTQPPAGPQECEASFGRGFVVSGSTADLLVRIPAECGAAAGTSLVSLGDITGDGVPDVGIGEPTLQRSGGSIAGVSGSDGSQIWCSIEQPQAIGSLGFYATATGDLTGDGYRDILVGAPFGLTSTDSLNGKAYVLSGYDGSVFREHESPSHISDGYFGGRVFLVGDQDLDGVGDYAVGEPLQTDVTGVAKLHIYSARRGERITSIASPAGSGTDRFGFSLANVGDKDGDTLDDFWVSAPGAGAVYLMNQFGEVIYQVDDPGTADGGILGFGSEIAATDLDGDSRLDLVIGSPNESVSGQERAGSVFLVVGGDFVKPDVFDDGDEDTPDTSKVWPTERNDGIAGLYTATPVAFTHINSTLAYDDLSFDTPGDADYFRVQLPPVQNVICNGFDRFTVTVSAPHESVWDLSPSVQTPLVTIYKPAAGIRLDSAWLAIDPIESRWATYMDDFMRVTLDRPRSLPILTDDDEIVLSIGPSTGLRLYDLDIRYECEPYTLVPIPSFNLENKYIDIFSRDDVDRTFETYLADAAGFIDCLSFPQLCDDPPNEYMAFEWDASPFEMVFQYRSPAEGGGDFSVSLLDREGQVMATAQPKQFFEQQALLGVKAVSNGLNSPSIAGEGEDMVAGEKILTAAFLDKQWYYLGIKGPFPTLYSYRLGDFDRDNVGSLVDNCFESYNPAQEDEDSDGRGDVCDVCPHDVGGDEDADGFCPSDGDCLATDAAAYPGARELCDGKDNDCDGSVDEGFVFEGFMPPLRVDGLNLFKVNSTVAVKFRLSDCQGSRVFDQAARIYLYRVTEGGTEEVQVASSGHANAGRLFRHYGRGNGIHIL